MPAHRSRTERWRELLRQILERRGGLEYAVAHQDEPGVEPAADLLWRSRLLGLDEREMLLEHPTAAGQRMELPPGTPLICVMSVGQNRWMFRATVLGPETPGAFSRGVGLRLTMPEQVDRCTRRDFLRTPTASLRLPGVRCWPLLSPTSAIPAEAACRAAIRAIEAGRGIRGNDGDALLPEVGPEFGARLMNIGGGGLGLLVEKADALAAERARLLWLRVDLTPGVPAPLGVTAKLAHCHRDSEQHLHAGVAFDFSLHAEHRPFIVEQITRYVRLLTGDITRASAA